MFHVMMRLSEDVWVARRTDELRAAARTVVELGRGAVLLFRVVGAHVHVVIDADRWTAGQFAKIVEGVLRRRLAIPIPFGRAKIKPVASAAHLTSLVPYVLRQTDRHDVQFDEEQKGSALPDLLSMRVLDPDMPRRLAALVPNLTRHVTCALPVPVEAFHTARPVLTPSAVLDAVAATLALPTLTPSRALTSLRARSAAITLLRPLFPTAELAQLLGVHPRTILRSGPADPALLDAARRQIQLRAALAQRRATDPWPLALPRRAP